MQRQNHYAPIRTTDATVEPLTLAEVKAHMRIDTSTEDALISSYITASRWELERMLGKSLIQTTWDLYLDDFPYRDWRGSSDSGRNIGDSIGPTQSRTGEILLQRSPIIAITAFAYTNQDGTTINMVANTDYILDSYSRIPRIVPPYGTIWPITALETPNTVHIQFTAGYGTDASLVPPPIKQALRLMVAQAYVVREPLIDGAFKDPPFGLNQIISGNRNWSF